MTQDAIATPERLMKLPEAARLMNCTTQTLKAMVKRGQVTVVRRSRTHASPWLFRPSDIATAQRNMSVPANLHRPIVFRCLDAKPQVELTEDPSPRFPRPSTATSPSFLYRTYSGSDGINYASLENPKTAAQAEGWVDADGEWHGPGTLPPGKTHWYVLDFPEK